MLVDVRETAWSRKPGFSKAAFSRALAAAGIEYVHARFAGNPKSLRRNATTHQECLQRYAAFIDGSDHIIDAFDELIGEKVAAGKRVCLTCFERHAYDCHRSIIADRWKRRGRRTVRHLAVEGCARMLS